MEAGTRVDAKKLKGTVALQKRISTFLLVSRRDFYHFAHLILWPQTILERIFGKATKENRRGISLRLPYTDNCGRLSKSDLGNDKPERTRGPQNSNSQVSPTTVVRANLCRHPKVCQGPGVTFTGSEFRYTTNPRDCKGDLILLYFFVPAVAQRQISPGNFKWFLTVAFFSVYFCVQPPGYACCWSWGFRDVGNPLEYFFYDHLAARARLYNICGTPMVGIRSCIPAATPQVAFPSGYLLYILAGIICDSRGRSISPP